MLVTIAGLLEIEGAIGLLLPQTAAAAAFCLAILLVALFRANVRSARQRFTIRGHPAMSVAMRGAMQAVFVASLLAAAVQNA